jgi:hypothetical protein
MCMRVFQRGIEDSNECSEATMNITSPHHNHHLQHHHQYPIPYQAQTTSPSSTTSSSSSSSNSCNLSLNGSSTTCSSTPYSPNIQYIATTASAAGLNMGANGGGPILYTLTPTGPMVQQAPQQQQQADLIGLNSNTSRPEAKKVKIQKSQPSKVVHIRNIPPQISEIEVIQFGIIFGNIATVLNLRSKCQVSKSKRRTSSSKVHL